MSEFEREMREFKNQTSEALGILVPMVGNILELHKSTAAILDSHSASLSRLGGEVGSLASDVAAVKELSQQTLEYSQAWAGDVKKVLRHLGIDDDIDT